MKHSTNHAGHATANPAYTTAKLASSLGLSTWPPREDGSKGPMAEPVDRAVLVALFGEAEVTKQWGTAQIIPTWKHRQVKPADAGDLARLYARGLTGVGLATGGELELFEFDRRDAYDEFLETARDLKLGGLVGRIEAGYCEDTPSGGVHWFYYCDVVEGNVKLARRLDADGDIKVLIETRGEGGYAIIAPTNGRVHPTGGIYTLRSGSLETIVRITPEERAALFALAKSFDEIPEDSPNGEKGDARQDLGRPGDDFINRVEWADVLEPHDWKLLYTRGETQVWRRPGKDGNGPSATVNHAGSDLLYVFSTKTIFPPNRGIDKFGAYARLNHGGNFAAAAADLAAKGFGSPSAAPSRKRAMLQSRDDFLAYLPDHKYVFRPTRKLWPASSVDGSVAMVRIGTDANGDPIEVWPSFWMDGNQSVQQMTWAPGEPEIIEGRYLHSNGWMPSPGGRCYNQYQPSNIEPGDAAKAGPWIDHTRELYPTGAAHIMRYLAFKVQRPGVKINHAIVLGGAQGIGKDTVLEPVKEAVGPWNVSDISPARLMERFNPHMKCVLLVVSEIRDLGDVNRYQFYEHTKSVITAPPATVSIDEKYVSAYSIPNVCGVIFTTNYKSNGMYLPDDDRRHFVAWSDKEKGWQSKAYFTDLYAWFVREGNRHVTAYLRSLDLSDFDPGAPPDLTEAWYAIVNANRSPESAELDDILDWLQRPDAVTIPMIAGTEEARVRGIDGDPLMPLSPDFRDWLLARKNARHVYDRLEKAGYVAVRNTDADDGYWAFPDRRRRAVYAKKELAVREQIKAVQLLIERSRALINS